MNLEQLAERARAHKVAGGPPPIVDGWEIIGPPDCPLLARRTLFAWPRLKVLLHRWYPDARDADPHDHPRPFVTFVLRGCYHDVARHEPCGGLGCPDCRGSGQVVDFLGPFALRYRSATHAHVTEIGPHGATTICVMGPPARDWGFWRDGRWYRWHTYERLFGFAFRCDR